MCLLEEEQLKVSLEDFQNADKQGTCLPCTSGDKPSRERAVLTDKYSL